MANWTKILMVSNYVFFTTITKNFTDAAATPTGVGCEEAKKARHCCIFYNIWHNFLDFIILVVYNKA